ncbi:RWD domain-containing protein [Amylocarpus encephaloides]|uniref:RBR-type E3 ubiquitin transferase n=1 Tax=Amylocarpus encephaloides TaxID=45428 RepID=A0A9P7YFN3_9HELO|nr:RWD domain-containing protein [Amylocarpus encephaloides]
MDDERATELECLTAIFPEIVLDSRDSFCASIELQVHPTRPVKVVFPAATDGILPTPPRSNTSGDIEANPTNAPNLIVESHDLSYLPSLHLQITLPEGYPEEKPPKFELSTMPSWLSRKHLDELQANGENMWEEAGRSVVAYGYIDFLQQAAENAFGFAEEGKILEIPQDYKISLLDLDIRATYTAFSKETFDCGICLDPKKGLVCHRMIDCGHVFCIECLRDYYNNTIKEGDLSFVRCLAPDCSKKRAEAQVNLSRKRKVKTQISPSELLQIPLEKDVVARYVKLKHQALLASDKNTIYCPRQWCQGAARSKKHPKPVGFEVGDSDEEEESDHGGEPTKKVKAKVGSDLLAVCEDCSFAFCGRCYQGWHGEFTMCIPREASGELTEEDKASLEYLKLHTTPCPTCAAPAQKTHGCNHMICFTCNSHFCYLCSAWLSPSNPYQHYNTENTACYMRLWELEGGDGNDVGQGYAGGRQMANPEDVVPVELVQDVPEIEAPVVVQEEPVAEVAVDPVPQAPLQREGPLVIRINHFPPQPLQAPPILDPPRGGRRNRRPGQQQRQPQPQPQNFRGGPQAGRRLPRIRAPRNNPVPEPHPLGQEAAQQAWVQMFVRMAMNDEEDQLDSDDEADGGLWEIPVR